MADFIWLQRQNTNLFRGRHREVKTHPSTQDWVTVQSPPSPSSSEEPLRSSQTSCEIKSLQRLQNLSWVILLVGPDSHVPPVGDIKPVYNWFFLMPKATNQRYTRPLRVSPTSQTNFSHSWLIVLKTWSQQNNRKETTDCIRLVLDLNLIV